MRSAFVGGRLIMDNIIVANEILHFMKGLRRRGMGYAALKLDIARPKYYSRSKFLRRYKDSRSFSLR